MHQRNDFFAQKLCRFIAVQLLQPSHMEQSDLIKKMLIENKGWQHLCKQTNNIEEYK